MVKEYKSREFCRAVKCPIQAEIDEGKKMKDACEKSCVKTAWEFHDWLRKAGYKITSIFDEPRPNVSNTSPHDLMYRPMDY